MRTLGSTGERGHIDAFKTYAILAYTFVAYQAWKKSLFPLRRIFITSISSFRRSSSTASTASTASSASVAHGGGGGGHGYFSSVESSVSSAAGVTAGGVGGGGAGNPARGRHGPHDSRDSGVSSGSSQAWDSIIMSKLCGNCQLLFLTMHRTTANAPLRWRRRWRFPGELCGSSCTGESRSCPGQKKKPLCYNWMREWGEKERRSEGGIFFKRQGKKGKAWA